jgi:hypothetical protein
MTKILIINSFLHEKNKQGLASILNKCHIGTVNDIPNYDIIYSPSEMINTSLYPTKKFIFGPHFSTFPNHNQLHALQNHVYRNSIYIHPSEWVVQLWKNMGAEQFLPLKCFPFPVNTEKFKPLDKYMQGEYMQGEYMQGEHMQGKDNVLVYYKHRHPNELKQIKDFLTQQKISNYRIFDYDQRYTEEDYLSYLQKCKYGIVLDAHESQGFAIEEALACDVPLLVWNAQTMNQELNSHYQPIPCTSIPYWDNQCGEYFNHHEELERKFQILQIKIGAEQYSPRQYILDNLSAEKCAERFMKLIQFSI